MVHSGLVIGTCSIGDNFVGHAGILVGQNGGEYPTIGSNVQMGAHSIVIGPIKVGNDVKIGAGTTVVKDVEDGHTIVSQAPRILPPKRGASE